MIEGRNAPLPEQFIFLSLKYGSLSQLDLNRFSVLIYGCFRNYGRGNWLPENREKGSRKRGLDG